MSEQVNSAIEIAALVDGSLPSLPPSDPQPEGPENALQPSQQEVTPWLGDDDADAMPSDVFADAEGVMVEALRTCAQLDQSDTDNGVRLRKYFPDDVLMLAERGSVEGQCLVWAGTHWDFDEGPAEARKLAQRIGGLIAAEADYMEATPRERAAIEEGDKAETDLRLLIRELPKKEKDWNDDQRARVMMLNVAIDRRADAKAALRGRQISRRKFGVSSKNKARIENMISCAAPHLRQPQEAFNRDDYSLATRAHTLRFVREVDPECPDPDAVRYRWRLVAEQGHRREDKITALVPVTYDPEVKPVKWAAFLERFMPEAKCKDKRRTLQQYCGLGLLGIVVQYVMFHYGEGANGKSVFLETLMRVLGESFAVSLPPETLIGGGERNAGGAAPDIMRMFGKRMLRVPEIKPGAPLQEDLIKRITGGEMLTARTLFKGYVDFQNKGKPHMSGNGFPKIDGTDNGIWRRMLVMHWAETIPEGERKEFEEVVVGLLKEAPAILNWLIDGALDYLNNGLFIAPEVRAATQEYRDEMDTVGQFARDCAEEAPGHSETARDMFKAYQAWCEANAKTAVLETKFGRVMKQKFKRDDKRIRRYLDVRLHDVPSLSRARPEEPPHPADSDAEIP